MLLSWLINSAIISLCVVLHYEALSVLSHQLAGLNFHHRLLVLVGVVGAMVAHVMEIWIFAAGFYFMNHAAGLGELQGNIDGGFLDCIYFSFTNYTTLGYGDIVPIGHIRFLAGLEALTGLVLITWSASFMFIEMQKYWKK